VADALALAGFARAVVVGHSMAGAVIPKVVELAPARVAHLVFLAAVVPARRGRLADHFPPFIRALFRGLARAGGGVVQYPAQLEHARWMTDLRPGDPRVVDALARLTPQPAAPWEEHVDYSRFYATNVPCTYVRCLGDAAVTPERAAQYAARLGVAPIDLDTAHGPMLSAPDELVRILERV
ncbi:MAG: alpha/beta fold hydrolase, partial [Candidatus Rokuibacteriota bacterium]